MRPPLTILILLATVLGCAAQSVKPPAATVMFSNSGSFVVKVNREPWLRGFAGIATPAWKESFVQSDAGSSPALRQTGDRWDFSGALGPQTAHNVPLASYTQTLAAVGDTLQLAWRFRMARTAEVELIHVSFLLPARRFAGKAIRFDRHDMTLPERPTPASQRPITGRPQRIVIDSGSLGPVTIHFNRPQVVWIEDRRQSGEDSFELRVLLATGELQAGDEYGLALQLELAEQPELHVGGNGREFQNDTEKWARFDLQDTSKPLPGASPQKRTATDASTLLHTPAGKFGVLQTKDGHFAWPNGARQKFWGVRLATTSAPTKDDAEAVATRMAQFGINLVRWTAHGPPADDGEIDRFDRFVAELARQGIYSHFTLPSPCPANAADAVPLVADRMASILEHSADAWLLRKNRHNGKPCADDRSLAVVQIASGHPLFQHPPSPAPARSELEIEFYRRIYKHLRKIGVKCPIVTDDFMTASTDLSALVSAGDAIGVGGSWDPLRPDGFIENKALVSSDGGYLSRFASASVAHKPLLITRIAHPQYSEHRAEAPLLVATHAALQDWDGVIWDDYSNDPAVIGQFPIAARIFLGGLVSPSRLNTYVQRSDSPHSAQATLPLWLTFISRWRNVLPNVAAPTPDIVIAADGEETPKTTPVRPPIRLVQKAGDASAALQRHWVDAARRLRAPLDWEEGTRREFASDNGQLAWDQDHGQFTLLSPSCCAAAGFIGGKNLMLADLMLDIGTPRFAAVSLTALDGSSIAESRRLLLTTIARCENTDQRWFENIEGDLKMLGAKPGTRIEPVNATITLHRRQAFKVFALDPAGHRGRELPANRTADGFSFVVNGESMFYEVVVEGGLHLWPFGK